MEKQPIYPSEDEVDKIRGAPVRGAPVRGAPVRGAPARGAPGLFKCKSPPGSGLGDQDTCSSKPPGSVAKFPYKPRNGITPIPPVESRPGGVGKNYYITYDSITRGSPTRMGLLIGGILPASFEK
jgi:hypothetical protein